MARGRNLIKRRKKLTILLDGSGNRTVNSVFTNKECIAEYDPAIFVRICKKNWANWMDQVGQEREKLLEEVGQYPAINDVSDLMKIEQIHVKMEQVIFYG